MIAETADLCNVDINLELAWLITPEYFKTFIHHDN